MGGGFPGIELPRPLAPHWERLRGIGQGRCLGTDLVPAGAACLVLGEHPAREVVRLSPGDWTEVRQTADLTGYDFVQATLRTVGQLAGTYQRAPGWAAHPAELWRFDGDDPGTQLVNRIVPAGADAGFPLEHVGAVDLGYETYSGARTLCRVIPAGLMAAGSLRGAHAPPAALPGTTLQRYTLQVIVRPALDNLATSWGWDMPVVQWIDLPSGTQDGVRLDLLGQAGPGAHGWYAYVTHFAGGSSTGTALTPWEWTATPAWCQLTLVYDATIAGAHRLRLYLDDALVATAFVPPTFSPRVPPATGFLEVAGGHSWGAWDAVRCVGAALSPAAVAASWVDAQTPGPVQRARWVQQLRIDGVPYAERTLVPAEDRIWHDFSAPVRRLTGPHEIAYRLTLAEEV